MVQETKGIPDASLCCPCNEANSFIGDREVLFSTDSLDVGRDLGRGELTKVESLATRENGFGDFVGLGRGEDEAYVGGRLFQCLQ